MRLFKDSGLRTMPSNRPSEESLNHIGEGIALFISRSAGQEFTTTALQAAIADLVVVNIDFVAPLKDLVSRQSFRELIPQYHQGMERFNVIN